MWAASAVFSELVHVLRYAVQPTRLGTGGDTWIVTATGVDLAYPGWAKES